MTSTTPVSTLRKDSSEPIGRISRLDPNKLTYINDGAAKFQPSLGQDQSVTGQPAGTTREEKMIKEASPENCCSQVLRPSIDSRADGIRALDALEQFGSTLRVGCNGGIYSQGAAAEYCWRVISGCVREVTFFADGRRAISRFLFPGDYFGFEDVGTHKWAAEAVTDVVLRRYPRHSCELLARHKPALALEMRRIALNDLRTARTHVLSIGRKSAEERVVDFFLKMERLSSKMHGQKVQLPMSRTDIADHLGLTIETVCRTLKQLTTRGLLLVTRGAIQFCSAAFCTLWLLD